MNDQNDPKTGSIPVKDSKQAPKPDPKTSSGSDNKPKFNQGQLDQGFEQSSVEQKDLGEAGELQDSIQQSRESEAANTEMVEANSELVMKIINQAKEFGFFGDEDTDGYHMIKQNASIFKLYSELTDVNGQLREKSEGEEKQKETMLENMRASLVTELLYSVTALMSSQIPKFKERLLIKVREAKNTGDNKKVVEDIEGVKKLTPQWEALVANSQRVVPFLKFKHPSTVSDEFLGNMNESLYLSMNLNTDTLDNEEDNSGTSVLSREMDNVTKALKELEELDVSDLESNASTGHSDIKHSGGGEITVQGSQGQPEPVLQVGDGKAFAIEVPTGETKVNIPGFGSVSGGESGKGGAVPEKKSDAEAVLEEDLDAESEDGGIEQSEENLDQIQSEEAQEDQQLTENEAVAEEQNNQPENDEGSQPEDEEKQLTEEEKRQQEQAQA